MAPAQSPGSNSCSGAPTGTSGDSVILGETSHDEEIHWGSLKGMVCVRVHVWCTCVWCVCVCACGVCICMVFSCASGVRTCVCSCVRCVSMCDVCTYREPACMYMCVHMWGLSHVWHVPICVHTCSACACAGSLHACVYLRVHVCLCVLCVHVCGVCAHVGSLCACVCMCVLI